MPFASAGAQLAWLAALLCVVVSPLTGIQLCFLSVCLFPAGNSWVEHNSILVHSVLINQRFLLLCRA